MQDAQTLPIHFNYNFMERDKIPLHNEKFSRSVADHERQTKVLKKGFFDNSLPTPSHVILNHINSWETMGPCDLAKITGPTVEGVQNMDSDAGTEGQTAAAT